MKKRRKRYYKPDYTKQQYINLFKVLGTIWIGIALTIGILTLIILR